MKYFTKEQVEEIRKQLATLGVRDTDLPNANVPLSGDELVAIVQNNENRKVGIRKLIHDYLPDDIASGQDGASAFDIWRSLPGNNDKTVQDFFDYLKGAKGDKGEKGDTGATGPEGQQGQKGAKGDKGDPGSGTEVGWVQFRQEEDSVKIAEIDINGVTTNVWAPEGGAIEVASKNNLGGIKIGYQTDSSTKQYAVQLDENNRAYVKISGSGSGGGDDEEGEGPAGRSITGTDVWYKLTADESVQATPMGIADPSSTAGGKWSLTAGKPTAQYPYLRAFMQVNYDKPLSTGYNYSRSSAFTARYFNSDSSAEYQDLVDALAQLRTDLFAELGDYDAAMDALNAALEALRSTIAGSVTNQLNNLKNRLDQIDDSEVADIRDNSSGLWGVLTSWVSETGDKKAFADIIANAQDAKITLQTGSTFFDHIVGGDFTLNGILGQIAARLTEQQARGLIQSATISVDSAALNSVIAASQSWWKKTINGEEVLYPYDLFWSDFITDNPTGTLYDYSVFMQKAPLDGGPDGDSERPDGPYEEVIIVNKFSQIKQAVDEVSSSVDETKYMWQKGSLYASYNSFETEYEERSDTYIGYTYDQYVTNYLGYTKIEVGAALSNITQKSDEIKLQLGDMGYFWRRATIGGGYEYQMYAVPSDKTRDQYVTEMQAAGWSRITYASKMSVIDQFPDSITALVKNSTNVWIDSNATGDAYCRAYDYWLSDYNNTLPSALSYEEYVEYNHPSYDLTLVTNSFSRIKQTADAISSAVSSVEGFDNRISAIEQTAQEIELSVTKSQLCWVSNSDGTMNGYLHFMDDYEAYKASASNPLDYEDWVENTKNCTLSDSFEEVSGVKIQGDKIWAGVGDGDELKASIEILADLETSEGKIVLTAPKVEVDGTLAASVVNAGLINAESGIFVGKINDEAEDPNGERIDGTVILPGSITTDKLSANAISAAVAEFIEANADSLFANFISTAGNGSYITIQQGLICFYDDNEVKRIEMGQGSGDTSPVLKFFNSSGQFQYDLGPDGITEAGRNPYAPARWQTLTCKKLPSSSTAPGSIRLSDYTSVTLYEYVDAARISQRFGTGDAQVEYYDPSTGTYNETHSAYHGRVFESKDLTDIPADGLYLHLFIVPGAGEQVSTALFDARTIPTIRSLGYAYEGNAQLETITNDYFSVIAWNLYQ